MKTFVAGMVTGIVVVAATGYAAGLLRWTRHDVDEANRLFRERSGLRFTVEPPPDPDSVESLVVHAHPVDGLAQLISVRNAPPGDTSIPPGPCLVAHLQPPGPPTLPPGPCRVTVFQPDQIAFEAADGTPLSLCSANGGPTIPTN